MQIFKWITNNAFAKIRSALHYIKETVIHLWNPLPRYEKYLIDLLSARKEIHNLAQTLKTGRSARQLLNQFELIAQQEKIDSEQCGKVNLLLSVLYQENIQAENFTLTKDIEKAGFYRERAEKILGKNPALSENSKRYIECIKCGGEPQFAFKKLNSFAEKNSDEPLSVFSAKALSFIYREGLSQENFTINSSRILSEKYYRQSFSHLQTFKTKLNQITKTLVNLFFDKPENFRLVKKIADSGNKFACHQYAEYLKKQKASSEQVQKYYCLAAKRTEENLLDLKEKGNIQAENYLISKHQGDYESNPEQSHFRFQVVFDQGSSNSSLLNSLLKDANNGGLAAILQAGLYHLKRNSFSLEEAENYFMRFLELSDQRLSVYEKMLFEKLCLKLARYYKELFLSNQSFKTFDLNDMSKEFLNKTIFYLQNIPIDSKEFKQSQLEIAEYQRRYLKNASETRETFLKLARQGDKHSANEVVRIDFETHWREKFSTEATEEQKKALESFFDQCKNKLELRTEGAGINSGICVIKDIVNQLELNDINHVYDSSVNNLKEKIKTYEENLVQFKANLKPRLGRVFDSNPFIDPAFKQAFMRKWELFKDNTPATHLISSEDNSLYPVEKNKFLLQAYLNFMGVIKEYTNSASNKEYFEMLEQSYFTYLIEKCSALFPAQIPKDVTISDLTFGDAISYAK